MRLVLMISTILLSVLAYADEQMEFNMDPPAIKKQKEQQVTRMPKIRHFKMKGQIGESETGMLAIREPKSLKKDELEALKKFVDEENRDRTVIIDEISKANKFDAKKKKEFIEVYYTTLRNVDPKGVYFFEKATWQKKY